jgi:hypothetical protein
MMDLMKIDLKYDCTIRWVAPAVQRGNTLTHHHTRKTYLRLYTS